MQAYPSLRYPKEVVGRAMGITNGIGQFGSFVSPLISGYLVITMPNTGYDFSRVFLFWSLLAIGAVISAAFLKETPVDRTKYEISP
jgi:ACS family glucarate transporter-like MFS transporter